MIREITHCIECDGKLVAAGNARVNGRNHNDWETRKTHKKCFLPFTRKMMPILNQVFDSTPRPIKCKSVSGHEYTIHKSEADKMLKTMVNSLDTKEEMLEWLESTALYEDMESPILDDLFKKHDFNRLTQSQRDNWYRITQSC